MKTITLFLLTVVLFCAKLSAQNKQNTPLEQAATAASSVRGLGSIETSYSISPFKFNGTQMNIQQVGGAITLPLMNRMKNGKLDFLLVGASYSGLFLSDIGTQFGGTKFHSISVPVTFQKSLSDRYAIIASFIPTLSSDLKDISGEDMLYSGAVLLKIKNSNRFNYSVGIAFSKQFFGTVLVPIIGVDWKISNKLSFSGTLPVSEKLKYQFSDKSAFGILGDLAIGGGSYRLSEKTNHSDYLQVQQLKAAVFYEYALSKSFSIEINAGYNFKQQLDLYSKDQKVNWVPFNDPNKRIPTAELEKAGISVQTGLKYRF